jgi:hypothetical protein
MNKTVTRKGIVIGRSFSRSLPPEEAAPIKRKAPPPYDIQDRAIMAVSALALLALAALLAWEWIKGGGPL